VLVLARQGAHVVLAARDPGRGDEALGQIRVRVPGGSVELRRLDLADLSSVHTFAEALLDERPQLDLLVNNAGVMAIPRARTADGFEMQLGTNHLGHFALTGLLLPALLKGGIVDGPARVVTLSSGVHRVGRLRRDDLMGERRYGSWAAYGQAKLANLLFTLELHRRARAAGLPLASLAAHPGYAATNLQVRGPQLSGSRLGERAVELGNRLLAQSAEMGAPRPAAASSTDRPACSACAAHPGSRRPRPPRRTPTRPAGCGSARSN